MDIHYFKTVYNNLFSKTCFSLIEIREKDRNKCWTDEECRNSAVLVARTPSTAEALLTLTKSYTSEDNSMFFLGSCSLSFSKTTADEINQIFSHLNYDYLFSTLELLYQIGKEFNFFDSMFFPQDFTFSDLYKIEGKNQIPKKASIGKVQLSASLYEKKVDRVNTISQKNIIMRVKYHLINDEIHPIISLVFPCGAKKMIYFDLNLHPSFDYVSERSEISSQFTKVLIEHIDLLLKRYMNLKQADLNDMPLDEKKQHLKIIEMSVF